MKAIPKRTLLVTCVVILLPMFFGLALWNRLPERMPTHFDFSGTADDYSGRPFAVIGLPLIILAMQLFCAVMLHADPKKQNISEKMMQLILWVCPAVSLFAGLMPVPGGVGVAEAGYTYGLQAIGVPSAIAVATALAFRLVTFYLPPLWCSQAMSWLRRNAYV